MTKKDYYEILGVSKEASKADIKKAYKRLAKKYHPDLNKEAGAADKFKEINEAASVLGDDEKRSKYDRFGTADGGFDFSNYEGFNGFRDFGSNFDFGDIFDAFFGGGFGGFHRNGGRQRSYRGADLRFDLKITLEEVAQDIEKTIIIPRMEICKKCSGKGAVNANDIESCSTCHGSGRVTKTQRTPFGLFQSTAACPECHGNGQIIKKPCPKCNGQGRIKENVKLKIKIPAGVEHGMRLRIAGEGEAGERNGPRGDLYVIVHIKDHEVFQRHGDDIYLEVPISFVQAALGDTITVPTLDGKTKVKIPAGTQTNTIFQIKGKGLPTLQRYGHGSQNIRVIVQTPEKLNKKQKELFKKLKTELGSESKPNESLFEKIFKK